MAEVDPKFTEAFDWAVVRLATYFAPTVSKPRLLFGSVSLLTKDRPRPIPGAGVESHKIAKGKSGKIFFRRVILSARDAIGWYHNVGAHGLSTPIPTEPGERVQDDGLALLPTAFEDDPQWPRLGVPLGTDLFSNAGGPGDPAPFRGSGAPRIHRRFGDNFGFEAVVGDATAIKFLSRRIHVDLSDYTEYLGGLVLIVPDPVLRHVQHFLIPAEAEGGPEQVIIRAVPRPQQSLSDLKLTVLERRSNLLSRFETVDMPSDGVVTISSSLPFRDTGYVISHPSHGILAYQQPTSFIRSVNVTMGVQGRRIKVQAPLTDSPHSPEDSYEVAEIEDDRTSSIGAAPKSQLARVMEAEFRRRSKASAKRYKQTWFDSNQRSQANSFIRAQVARARSSVTVVDPYFGAQQIGQFLYAAPRTQIDFIILTSRLAFETNFAEDLDTSGDLTSRRAENTPSTKTLDRRLSDFSKSLKSLRARGMKSVTALVLSRTPPLHDRFLVIDDEVLFLGNSLNALGIRASLIVAVPDGEPVLAKLRSMATGAMPFEAYAKQRGQATSAPGEG